MPRNHSYTSEGNTIIKFIWNILFVVFYPLITTFSLLFVGILYVFSVFSTWVSRISTSVDKGIEIKKPTWTDFINVGNYRLEKLYVDEIMFGPAYYKFRTTPAITALENKLFGDFKHPFASGFLLQQWNTINVKEIPDFQLVYFDCHAGTLKDITQIKSFSWTVSEEKEGEVTIKWFTGTEGGEVVVTQEAVLDK